MSHITPPPTFNALPPSQRTRLRKSSRKLEAVLGATPIVLEVNVLNDPYVRVPATPRTKARRRRGQVFETSSASSSDNEDEQVVELSIQADNEDYVFITTTTPHARYQPHSLPGAVSPTKPGHRARSKSEVVFKHKHSKSPKPLPLPPLPSQFRLDLPLAGEPAKSQPVMIAQGRHKSVASISSLMSELASPPTTEAHEKEARRKKLAKLTRTLGENVPPELVFPANKPAATSSRPKRVSVRRSPEIAPSASPSPPAKKFHRAHRPRSLSVPSVLPCPMIEIEQTTDADDEDVPAQGPSQIIIDLSPPTPLPAPPPKEERPQYSQATIGYKRTRGANSLDSPYGRVAFDGLKMASTKANSTDNLDLPKGMVGRGTVSLDMARPSPAQIVKNPLDYVYGKSRHTRNHTSSAAIFSEPEELHRRKERDWSGEWNVQDMGDVVRRLRELKGR